MYVCACMLCACVGVRVAIVCVCVCAYVCVCVSYHTTQLQIPAKARNKGHVHVELIIPSIISDAVICNLFLSVRPELTTWCVWFRRVLHLTTSTCASIAL